MMVRTHARNIDVVQENGYVQVNGKQTNKHKTVSKLTQYHTQRALMAYRISTKTTDTLPCRETPACKTSAQMAARCHTSQDCGFGEILKKAAQGRHCEAHLTLAHNIRSIWQNNERELQLHSSKWRDARDICP